ncbi:hypothetical protein AGLY_001277 [Aphis glycines]|uniref:Uncharacterized protein n=1 Tax=Aphis glycines TaxID=307491 RepID=A0A6G0U9I4_APHGL|nr:hypothetical protein AGLY_001277 [Aphis glycines]
MYSYNFLITIRITYEELCIPFSKFFLQIFEEKFMKNLIPNFKNLVIKEKIFTIFQPQNYLQIFAILTYFKPCIKFSKFSGQPKNFYCYLKKKYLEKLKISIQNKKFDFDVNWFCVKNPIQLPFQRGAEVKNRSIFTAPNVVDRQKKKTKTKTHIIVKSIHSSLRSESNTDYFRIQVPSVFTYLYSLDWSTHYISILKFGKQINQSTK